MYVCAHACIRYENRPTYFRLIQEIINFNIKRKGKKESLGGMTAQVLYSYEYLTQISVTRLLTYLLTYYLSKPQQKALSRCKESEYR